MKKRKHKKRMHHDYHIRLDDETWDCLQALRKDDPDFNVSEWMRKEIQMLYSQKIFYNYKEWDLLRVKKSERGTNDGEKKKRTWKTKNDKKTR